MTHSPASPFTISDRGATYEVSTALADLVVGAEAGGIASEPDPAMTSGRAGGSRHGESASRLDREEIGARIVARRNPTARARGSLESNRLINDGRLRLTDVSPV